MEHQEFLIIRGGTALESIFKEIFQVGLCCHIWAFVVNKRIKVQLVIVHVQ